MHFVSAANDKQKPLAALTAGGLKLDVVHYRRALLAHQRVYSAG
ncbi:hypothetical protein LPJGGPFB_01463 [Ensifer adhaerens]|nr:hypothetical protein [Ensifer adhaerens]